MNKTYEETIEEDLDNWNNNFSEQSYSCEVHFRTKQNESVWMQLAFSQKNDTYYATGRNITRRKRAEERLLKQMQFTEDIIRHLPDIFFLVDQKENVKKWNNNLVTQLKGTLEVDLDHGTTFTIRFKKKKSKGAWASYFPDEDIDIVL